MDATCIALRFYSSGVFDDPNCGFDLDHAVQAKGSGVDNSQNYWNIKNSWTSDRGENGYIRIAAVAGRGICGI